MLVSKDEVKKLLLKKFEKIDKNEQRKLSLLLASEYKIPPRISSGLFGFTKDPEELGDKWIFISFCIMKVLDMDVSKYFTATEISIFENEKYPDGKAEFPLKIKCIQIAEDQWTGKLSAKDLIGFGRTDLIRYEADTQRVMRRYIRGGEAVFRINLDRRAVSEIKQLFLSGRYVPNIITLNIPLGKGDFYYSEETSELIIRELDSFNIIDGYHRYRALASIITDDEDFDYPLEVRITNFDNDKANSFIWQEDQKNRMAKVDSNSFNPTELSNRITNRVNQASNSNIQSCLNRSGGNINFSDFATCVNYFYLSGVNTKENQNQLLITISSDIIGKWNRFTDLSPEFITKIYTFKDVCIIFYLLKNKEPEEISGLYSVIIDKVKEEGKESLFYGRRMTRRVENWLSKF